MSHVDVLLVTVDMRCPLSLSCIELLADTSASVSYVRLLITVP